MRHAIAIWLILAASALPGRAQSPNDLFQEATLEMFDGNWSAALEKLERLDDESVPAELRQRSYFFAARALEKSNRLEEALERYEKFLASDSRDQALRKEAGFARVKVASQLVIAGEKEFAGRVLDALHSSDPELRLMAAVQLSYFPDPNLRRKAVPVLQDVLAGKQSDEVRNQAALAMLRIDPRLLEKKEPKTAPASGKNLRLLLRDGDGGEIRLTLPVSLARIALGALPESAREDLRKEGINPDNILEMLSAAGEVLEVESGGSVIRLWIE